MDYLLNIRFSNRQFYQCRHSYWYWLSVLVVALAALNLLLNFEIIEKGVELRAAKYMEWYSAFGLLVTIVWLYLEILRLLSKLNRN